VTPIFNEGIEIYNILKANLNLKYSNYNYFLIDDKSTDNTVAEIERFLSDYPENKITLIKSPDNLGKAGILNMMLKKHITSEYFICLDSDSELAANSLQILNYYIKNEQDNNVGAYTSSIKLSNPDGGRLLRLQELEYRSIIVMIKRAQMFLTKEIMTLSGAFAAYKTKAINDVGGFDLHNATEDIEVT